MPEPVFANIGKLLLATQIYDMHRLAHEVSGGLIVALPGPDEDHNPATAATLAEVLRANPAVPYDKRIEVARFVEDLTASYQGGWYSRHQPSRRRLAGRHEAGDLAQLPGGQQGGPGRAPARARRAERRDRAITRNRQPGRCCDTGCTQPGQAIMVPLPSGRTR